MLAEAHNHVVEAVRLANEPRIDRAEGPRSALLLGRGTQLDPAGFVVPVGLLEDLFVVTPGRGLVVFLTATGEALVSLSVWPFYGLLGTMLFIVRFWLLPAA